MIEDRPYACAQNLLGLRGVALLDVLLCGYDQAGCRQEQSVGGEGASRKGPVTQLK